MSTEKHVFIALHKDIYSDMLQSITSNTQKKLIKKYFDQAKVTIHPKADHYVIVDFGWMPAYNNAAADFIENYILLLDDKDIPYDYISIGENSDNNVERINLNIIELIRKCVINEDVENSWLEES